MLRRKIESRMIEWKNTSGHKPLIIKGCRQCGKTYSVLDFAHKNYKHVVYLNFFENTDYTAVFAGSLEVDNIIMMLSALLGSEAVFVAGETVLVLDEIHECPEARTALKFFRTDGRFDVIGTGSLLGVKGYGKEPHSVPLGSETVIDMYPLDFEEFLWANGISEQIIGMLQNSLDSETPVPEALHNRMRQLLLQYTVVGGMPDAVQTFVETKQMDEVLRIQRDIVRSYEDDMVKYAEKKDKSNIRECFQSILKKPHSDETMLRCVLEGFTYLRTVDKEKLLENFELPKTTVIRACPFVFKGGVQYEEMHEPRPHLKRLMALLDSKPYYITKSDGGFIITED